MMDDELKRKWVEALRSGNFQQCRRILSQSLREHRQYCCIGVGGVVAGLNVRMEDTETCSRKIGLTIQDQRTLIELNDYKRASFPEIADYIEANL